MSRGTVNKAVLIGRLGQDPELRYAPSGTAIASFSMATNHRTKGSDGEWEEVTEWHNIVTFGRQAEVAGEYLKKGKLVYIEGRIQTSSWEDKEGQKRYKTEIVVNDLQLLGSKGDGDYTDAPTAKPVNKEAPAPAKSKSGAPEAAEEEDDLPF